MPTPSGPGRYGDPSLDNWDSPSNTGSYVGVPDAYKVQIGYQANPAEATHYGVSAAFDPVYAVPQYHYADIQALWGKPSAQVLATQMKLYALGYLPSFVPGTMTQKVQDAAEKAMTDANRNGLTLEQMLAKRNQALGAAPGAAGGGGGGGGGPTSSTSYSSSTQKSISLTSREGAYAVLANALGQELGRAPTQAELTRFTNALNSKERANPTVTQQSGVTQTTQSVSGSHATSHSSSSGTSTSKQGNVDAGYEALQFADSKPLAPERNRFQDSQYMDTIAQMIGVK